MQLESITYAQFEGQSEEWRITDFPFGDINLIVGKNATGKSRTLNVIRALGNLVSGDIKLRFRSGNYKAIFKTDDKKLEYSLKYRESKVFEEKLIIGTNTKLDRGPDGKGTIEAVEAGQRMNFQAPLSELACVNRRDNVQHPFFEDLYQWGKNLRHYAFGEKMGSDYLAVFKKDKEEKELNLKETTQVVAILKKGQERYKTKFIDNVKADMAQVGFGCDNITVGPMESITFEVGLAQPQCILINESDLKGTTEQNSISQGMFRALSLVIQLNYSLLASVPSCILIDDIGEGLDYERASALIKLLIDKAKETGIQLIMSTNDRFVMIAKSNLKILS